jgi:hypothetical protein
MSNGPVVHISQMGNLGNQMIQYMVARAVADYAGPARLSAVGLSLFGLHHPLIEGDFPATEIVTGPRVEVDRLARALATGRLQRVDIRTYGQRIENFLPAQAYRPVFVADAAAATGLATAGAAAGLATAGAGTGLAAAGAADDELLCNIRQGDILDGHHPDYVLLPIAFYADLVALTGLRPVFLGQLDDTPYLQALRARFPMARFVASEGAAVDFERIRRSRHIVPAISTFSWLAAWLSDAEQIFLAVLGLFNPAQNRAVDLLPLYDSRYRFFQFPAHYASPVAGFAAAHAALGGLWRQMPGCELAALLSATPPPRRKGPYCAAFDEHFYRASHADIAAAIDAGQLPSGRHHYETCGFDEGRIAFALDRAAYCQDYPIAALEIAQGAYWAPEHHWLECGRARGYRVPKEGKVVLF